MFPNGNGPALGFSRVSLETKKARAPPRDTREKPRELEPEGQHTGNCRAKFFCWIFASLSATPRPVQRSYLVDPASSLMLVSKIEPCMSKPEPLKSFIENKLWVNI